MGVRARAKESASVSAIFGELLNFPQEQGPEVRLRVFGDERYARYEDIDGYTMVYDKARGLFCYATLAGNRFASTGKGDVVDATRIDGHGLGDQARENVVRAAR